MKGMEHEATLRRPKSGHPGRDFEHRLAAHIDQLASGRIRDLDVVCSKDSIILKGWSKTYHAKQLAQQAVLDLTDGFPLLTNQIVVT